MNLAGEPSQMTVFNALYSIAAEDSKGEALFGNCFDLAQNAYEHTLIDDGFPTAYIEFPLLGLPGFDLSSIHSTMQKACADDPMLLATQFDRKDGSRGRFALCRMFNYAKVMFAGTVAQPAKFYLRMSADEVEA